MQWNAFFIYQCRKCVMTRFGLLLQLLHCFIRGRRLDVGGVAEQKGLGVLFGCL